MSDITTTVTGAGDGDGEAIVLTVQVQVRHSGGAKHTSGEVLWALQGHIAAIGEFAVGGDSDYQIDHVDYPPQ